MSRRAAMGSPAISDASAAATGAPGRRLSFDAGQVAWRVLGDAIVVYSDRSGATHQFGEFDGWVARRIAEGPTTLDALAAEAAELTDLAEPQLAQRLAEIVQALDDLALLGPPA